MKKIKNFLTVLLCTISMIAYGCDSKFFIITPSDGTNTDTIKAKYVYSLPLKVTLDGECNEIKNKISYEIKVDGTFSYAVDDTSSDNSISKMETRKLSQFEIESFNKLLKELDLALLAEKDTPVKLDGPQTTECRTVENFVMLVNVKERNFDFNSRTLIHTDQYLNALNKLRTALEQLKNTVVTTYAYALPLKLTLNGECSLGDKNLYEIKEDGSFYYYEEENLVSASSVKLKKLTALEIKGLTELLNNLNIAFLAEKDKDVPDSYGQTEECRTVKNFTMQVNGKVRIFDLNGRKIIHTQEYKDALTKLEEKLKSLTKDSLPVKYTYDLPLKITDSNECSASIAPRVLYQVNSDGGFTYFIETNEIINGIISTTNQGFRKLSQSELTDLKFLIENLDIALMAEKDQKVPAGSAQTKECRTVKNFTMQVNASSRTFDYNGRTLIHTEDYKAALAKLENTLKSLRTPMVTGYTYELPLKVLSGNECMSSPPKTVYEVTLDGTLNYNNSNVLLSDNSISDKIGSRKLSTQELSDLKALLNKLNIALLAEKDQKVSAGTPQTADCKAIKNFIMQVNGKERIFDLYSRTVTHTTEYVNALNTLETKLKEFSSIPDTQKYTYSLPLKVNLNGECGLGDRTLYEITSVGRFTYNPPANVLTTDSTALSTSVISPVISRQLSDIEIKDLTSFLYDLNIALLAEKDQKVPAGSPQTMECRTVKNFVLTIFGQPRTFDLNGRTLIHTDEYKSALAKLEIKLESLKTDNLVYTSLNTSFKLKLAQTAYISTDDLRIKFSSVVEDSRCPANVMCIQAGQITVRLNVMKGTQSLGDIDLTLRDTISSKKIGDYNITFENVDSGSIGYVISLKVTK